MSWLKKSAVLGLAVLLAIVGLSWWWGRPVAVASSQFDSNPAQLERGAYLARAGNCMACHTARGGLPYAGGRGIETPFGMVYAGNLTPDVRTGLGSWSRDDFWRALHHGQSRDGRLLYPAFPYTNTTLVSREDADALFSFLQSLPPVEQMRPAHEVAWPFNSQLALGAWRTLYFTPGLYQADPAQSAEWNRGAYLVKGLGHCSACHTARNALGATRDALDLAGGLIPLQNWYAPSLTDPAEAGVMRWSVDEVVRLLKHGVTDEGINQNVNGTSHRAWVSGPMGEVVQGSTQYLSDADLRAMAVFLQALPVSQQQAGTGAVITRQFGLSSAKMTQGQAVYEKHCAQCHGEQGQGKAGAYPTLSGNRAVNMHTTANLVQMLLYGGYSPATQGNPRPYGMPPYVLVLKDSEVAAVLTYVRNSWGNEAAEVSEVEVNRHRTTQGH
jgi:mono/diheme cytochrome c family protein